MRKKGFPPGGIQFNSRLMKLGAMTPMRCHAVAAAVLILVPVLSVAMPPLLDYPNHLARYWLLSGGAARLPMSGMFVADWGHSATNLATDVVGAGLDCVLPAEITGRIILGLAAALPVLGAALLSRSLHGRWSYWQMMFGLLAWPLVLLTGFMSLQLAFGAALIAAWLDRWFKAQPRWRALLFRIVACLVIILVHPFGVLLYAVLVTGLAIGTSRPDFRGAAIRMAWAWLPIVLALALTGLRMLLGQGDSDNGDGLPALTWDAAPWQDPFGHLAQAIVGPLRSYSLALDWLFVVLLWLPVAVALRLKRLRVHFGLLLYGACLFIVGLIAPNGIGSTSMVDVRLWTMTVFVLPLAVLPDIDIDRRWRTALCALALAVVGGRSLWLTGVWRTRQPDIHAMYRALDPVPPGARLLPVFVTADDDTLPVGRWLGGMTPSYAHLPTLALLRRHVYVPSVFAQEGKQPLRVLPPYDETHEVSGGLPASLDDLRTQNTAVDGYLRDWPQHFDYVLVLNADAAPVTAPADQGYAKLYRVAAHCRGGRGGSRRAQTRAPVNATEIPMAKLSKSRSPFVAHFSGADAPSKAR